MQTNQETKHPGYFQSEQGKQMPIRRLLCQIHLHFYRKRPRTQSQNRCTFIVSPPQGSTHMGTKQQNLHLSKPRYSMRVQLRKTVLDTWVASNIYNMQRNASMI